MNPRGSRCAAVLLITRHVRSTRGSAVECRLGMARRRRPASQHPWPTSRACVVIPPARFRSPPPYGGANKPGLSTGGQPLIPARSLALMTAAGGAWPRSAPPVASSLSRDCPGFTAHSLRRLARHSSYRATSTVVRQRGFEPPTSAPVIADCGGIRTRCCIHRTAGGGALRPHSSAATSRCTRHVVATPPRAATAADTQRVTILNPTRPMRPARERRRLTENLTLGVSGQIHPSVSGYRRMSRRSR